MLLGHTCPETKTGFKLPAPISTLPAFVYGDKIIKVENKQILSFANQIKNDGLSFYTIEAYIRNLKMLSKLCNITEPEEVKSAIANLNIKNITKMKLAFLYTTFLRTLSKKWKQPKYIPENKIPFIPSEQEIDQLIGACGKKTATLLQTLKETGMRIKEATMLKWSDLDTNQRTINITPAKGSNPRIMKISDKLVSMLNQMPRNSHGTIFAPDTDNLRTLFCHARKKASIKLCNDKLNKITFHTFRHWKATTEYHKTKDILYVKRILGHKTVVSTEIYINIEQALWLEGTDEWTCKVAHNETEAIQLIEANFAYVNNIGELAFYKKRK